MLLPDVLAVLRALNDEGVEYAVFGGVALNLHGINRATEDLDIFVRPEPANVEKLRRALARVYDDPHIAEISSQDLCGDYPAVRYIPPDGDFYLDILTRLGEAARYSDLEAEVVEVEGIPIRVVTPRQLYRLKKDTVRGQDRAVAARIRVKFDLGEEGD
jgi:hypothetical protein